MNLALEEICDMIETELTGSAIKKYYIGEVILVPRSYCPAIMVFGTNTGIAAKGTAKDQYTYSITIRVVYDVTQFYNEEGVDKIIKAQEELMNIIAEQETDGTLKDGTIIAALRKNIRGEYYLFNDQIEIEYKMLEAQKYFYVSADISLTATTDLILRPTL